MSNLTMIFIFINGIIFGFSLVQLIFGNILMVIPTIMSGMMLVFLNSDLRKDRWKN